MTPRYWRSVVNIFQSRGEEGAEVPTDKEVLPLAEITNQATGEKADKDSKARPARSEVRRERGPPADGIPSKNKVMVANLPYDLSEEKVCSQSSNLFRC